jgi:hypothetical protein
MAVKLCDLFPPKECVSVCICLCFMIAFIFHPNYAAACLNKEEGHTVLHTKTIRAVAPSICFYSYSVYSVRLVVY